MNRPYFFVLRLLAAWLVLIGIAQAQGVTIRLLAFRRVGDAREVMVAGADGKPLSDKPLALPTEQISPPLTVGSRSLVFLMPAASGVTNQEAGAAPAAAASGIKEVRSAETQLLGKVELPATGKDFILVFLPASEKTANGYRVDAVPVPAGGFGSGDQVFVNYSGSTVGFVIAGEKIQVPNGKSAFYHPKKTEGNCSIIGYCQQQNGEWSSSPFYSSRMVVQAGVRNLILIVRDPKTGEPDFRGIADLLATP